MTQTSRLNPDDPDDRPPHLSGAVIARPVEVGAIHARVNNRCMAALVVNVNSEDPLSAVFTVDAVIFQPPQRTTDRFEKAHTRPGTVRWINNMQHAEPAENKPLTWHYVTEACLPAVVLQALADQRQP